MTLNDRYPAYYSQFTKKLYCSLSHAKRFLELEIENLQNFSASNLPIRHRIR